jgi:hypothetical protein
VRGDLSLLRIPAPRAPAPAERLWQHTCCEIFLARTPGGVYQEFNFSPSGEWAAYAFRAYRDGEPVAVPDPRIIPNVSPYGLELSASIDIAPGRHRAALCVVIEQADGRLSYWALAHPPGRPDFHHADGFRVEIE